MKKLIAFDLDDTLAISKSPVDKSMAELLKKLSERYLVCVITGGTYNQIKTQVIDNLNLTPKEAQRFHLMPTCGTRYIKFNASTNAWDEIYAEDLTETQKAEALDVLEKTAKKYGIWVDEPYGPILEDRGSQITYSALGQLAPPEKKYEWKAQNTEAKIKVRDEVASLLPNLEVRLGGSTSIDITRPNIDKAYGMKKLLEILGLDKEEVLFFGDNLQVGGNDYPVKELGIESVEVEGWEDTADKLERIINEQ